MAMSNQMSDDLEDDNIGQGSGAAPAEEPEIPRRPTPVPSIGLDTLQQSQWHTLSSNFPRMRRRIIRCIADFAGRLMDQDLVISMPRLEEIDIVEELSRNQDDPGDEDDEPVDMGPEIRRYVKLLAQFNNYVGQGMENVLVDYLNNEVSDRWNPDGHDLMFARNTVQFPDLILTDSQRRTCYFTIELKTWYTFAGDPITARFHAAPKYIKKDCPLVVFPWCMSRIVYGSPRIFRPLVFSARKLAERRDYIWVEGLRPRKKKYSVETPDPDHLFRYQPNNHNIKSTGYQWNDSKERWEVESDNFGKVHRFYHPVIYSFEDRTWDTEMHNSTIGGWFGLVWPTKGMKGDIAKESGWR